MNDEQLHAHLIGRQGSRLDLNTPVLVLDLDALDRNIAVMAAFATKHGVKLRPHAKTHKSPDIAKRQIVAGAVGLCCAKLGEAEALAEHGVTQGLHISSPVVSPPAIARLIALNQRTEGLMCVVDHPDNARAIGAVARTGAKPLEVIIDIDPGLHRTGVASPETAVALLRAIQGEPALTYRGVQFYCGREQHIQGFAERREAMTAKAAILRASVQALTAAGGAPEIVTGGGTGTHRIDVTLGLFTELQVGSYVLMDREYLACDLMGDGTPCCFDTALMIDARVVSANAPRMVTIDAGFKAMSTDAGPPTVLSGAPPETSYVFMGDEHGALILPEGASLALGERVTLSAPHCDPTVNLYDTFHALRGDTLEALWPVAGRGRSR